MCCSATASFRDHVHENQSVGDANYRSLGGVAYEPLVFSVANMSYLFVVTSVLFEFVSNGKPSRLGGLQHNSELLCCVGKNVWGLGSCRFLL